MITEEFKKRQKSDTAKTKTQYNLSFKSQWLKSSVSRGNSAFEPRVTHSIWAIRLFP